MPAPPFLGSVWALVCLAVRVLCREFISAILAAPAIWAVMFPSRFAAPLGCRLGGLPPRFDWTLLWVVGELGRFRVFPVAVFGPAALPDLACLASFRRFPPPPAMVGLKPRCVLYITSRFPCFFQNLKCYPLSYWGVYIFSPLVCAAG